MDATATSIADYLARFASAVVPREDFDVFPDMDDEPNSFNVFLRGGSTFNFRPVDEHGNLGMILYFADIKVPQGEDLFDLQGEPDFPFDDFEIRETADDHTLLILYAGEEAPMMITATGDEKHLAHV